MINIISRGGKMVESFFNFSLSSHLQTDWRRRRKLLQTVERLVLAANLQVLAHSNQILHQVEMVPFIRNFQRETSILQIMLVSIAAFVKSPQLQLPFLSTSESSSCNDMVLHLGTLFSRQGSYHVTFAHAPFRFTMSSFLSNPVIKH